MRHRIAIVGYGKIARDQHHPAIDASPDFELVAVATRSSDPCVGVPWFPDVDALLAGMADGLDAVAICTGPGPRPDIARPCIEAGLAVLLEKPPAATLGALDSLTVLARAAGTPLYAAWHSQHAPAVEPARVALACEQVAHVAIDWREDVRKWHPGQDWVFQPGGYGVFDPGINGFSILSRVLCEPLILSAARLLVPANRQAPIAAELSFSSPPAEARLDWRHEGEELWTIRIATRSGRTICVSRGGGALSIDGIDQPVGPFADYPSVYRCFAEVIADRRIAVDHAPLRVVADAFLIGERVEVEQFEWGVP